jgi:soluble lytic murein transglycosylase-like protein
MDRVAVTKLPEFHMTSRASPNTGADMIRTLSLTTILVALAAAIAPASAQRFASDANGNNGNNGNLDALIARHAAANNIPEDLVRRVIKRESGGRPHVVSAGNYGLMQIKLPTARSMGYTGTAAGLLDADTNMTYAVKYLAGAYRVAGGNASRAVHHYAAGYYYAAKAKGMPIGQPDQAQASFASTAPVSDFKFSPQEKLSGARSHSVSVASSSSLYSGRLDYY